MPESLAVAVPERDALLSKKLEWALDHLPERMRKVLILHDVEGYTHDETVNCWGLPRERPSPNCSRRAER